MEGREGAAIREAGQAIIRRREKIERVFT